MWYNNKYRPYCACWLTAIFSCFGQYETVSKLILCHFSLYMHEHILPQSSHTTASHTPPHMRHRYLLKVAVEAIQVLHWFERVAFTFISMHLFIDLTGISCTAHRVRSLRACCPHLLVGALVNYVVYSPQVHDVATQTL